MNELEQIAADSLLKSLEGASPADAAITIQSYNQLIGAAYNRLQLENQKLFIKQKELN